MLVRGAAESKMGQPGRCYEFRGRAVDGGRLGQAAGGGPERG